MRGQINYLQFDPNKTIIKNNYLISSSVIIDTDSKEILWKKSKWDNFELYMLRGDSVIFRAFKTINREEKSIFNCYDLKHKTFRNFPENTKLNSNQFESRISRYKVSPDGKKAIYTLNSDSGSSRENRILHDLYYKPQNTFKSYNKNINERTIAKKISIARMGNIELSKVGTAWLDNHTIL